MNVLKAHYMVFTPRNKLINDTDVKIHNVPIQRVYANKFLRVQIDAQLTWKTHTEYTCKKLSKCIGILCKARKKLFTEFYLQNKIVQMIWGSGFRDYASPSLKNLALIKIVHLDKYRVCKETMKSEYRSGALLFFKVINYISRSQRSNKITRPVAVIKSLRLAPQHILNFLKLPCKWKHVTVALFASLCEIYQSYHVAVTHCAATHQQTGATVCSGNYHVHNVLI